MSSDGLVFEKFDETVRIVVHVREKVLDSSSGIIFTADAEGSVNKSPEIRRILGMQTYKDLMRGPNGQATVATVAPIWIKSAMEMPYGWYFAYLSNN